MAENAKTSGGHITSVSFSSNGISNIFAICFVYFSSKNILYNNILIFS